MDKYTSRSWIKKIRGVFCYIYRMKISIINGPNLNLLGTREPGIYGRQTFEEFLTELKGKYPDIQIDYFQSNVEGELVNELQKVGFSYDGILLNAAAYTHTSVAIGDAIAAIKTPVIEIHISNIAAREEYRSRSLIAAKSIGSIAGLGLKGYELGIRFFL
jgi:3-dehydroquinate dehydratase II